MGQLLSALWASRLSRGGAPAVRGMSLNCRTRVTRASIREDRHVRPKLRERRRERREILRHPRQVHARPKRQRRARTKPVPIDRLAVWVADRVGSMGFFFVVGAWTILWLGWNRVGPAQFRFDPGPAFAVWLFITNPPPVD